MKDSEWIHRLLDGQDPPSRQPAPDTPEGERWAEYRETLDLLAEETAAAPEDLLQEVLAALPAEPERTWGERLRCLWPGGTRWLAPTLAGALAALLLVVVVGRLGPQTSPDAVAVTFEVHAPGAHEVDLVGSFNGWRPGELVLRGPDAAGYWTTTVRLPSGRYEYLFLVDGKQWVTDPWATAHRPDGFGRANALIEL
jgi:hypothetical protein